MPCSPSLVVEAGQEIVKRNEDRRLGRSKPAGQNRWGWVAEAEAVHCASLRLSLDSPYRYTPYSVE